MLWLTFRGSQKQRKPLYFLTSINKIFGKSKKACLKRI
jgi:hypothetical protein